MDGINCRIEKADLKETYLVIRKGYSKFFYSLKDMDLSGVSIDQYVLLNKQSHSVIAFDKCKEILEDIIDHIVKLRVESEAKKPKKSNSRKMCIRDRYWGCQRRYQGDTKSPAKKEKLSKKAVKDQRIDNQTYERPEETVERIG